MLREKVLETIDRNSSTVVQDLAELIQIPSVVCH